MTHTQKDKNRIHRMKKYTILGLFWSVTHSLCSHIFFFRFFLCSNYEFIYTKKDEVVEKIDVKGKEGEVFSIFK